jgi:predicted small lipoprotein YifL
MSAADRRSDVRAKRRKGAGSVVVIGLVAAALALAGCGRRGPLELPPDASVEGQPKSMPAGRAPEKVPERSFVLDGIL